MKTIYEPKGKAAEYAAYAVNFYNGCSNGCEYCYLKRGVLSKTLGGNTPKLQKRYLNEDDAFGAFMCDIVKKNNLTALQKHGLFFTFSSDPCIEDTWRLNADAIIFAQSFDIPCTILTKTAGMTVQMVEYIEKKSEKAKELLAVGFTLTGHDELEPNASTNKYRTLAMQELHKRGYKTWASIEPIIDVDSSLGMMLATINYCDHYKVGLRSGVKKDYYSESTLQWMLRQMKKIPRPIYLKDSFCDFLGLDRGTLVEASECDTIIAGFFVGADFNLFRNG